MNPDTPSPPSVHVRIWDAPLRLVHWLIVLCVAISWWTSKIGELEYHRYSGYVLLGLLVFRLYWGFAGGDTARFVNFIKGPKAILAYLRQLPQRAGTSHFSVPGHNPLGALSVIVLLVLLLAQVGLGLFAGDVDGIESGPLSSYVSFETTRTCAELHEQVFNFLLGFIVLHVVAVLFYLIFKRDNLIAAMIHGRRAFHPHNSPQLRFASWPRLLIGIAIAAFTAWIIARGLKF
ncbi:MAG TPA: cytochrome b/b6 domain-containing protein [Steroidobacteraceae bacterium]|jgi:cytochrome b